MATETTKGAMYLAELQITNFRQFSDSAPGFRLEFCEGVTALVGENDSGKTAIIDAIRHVLLTRDQDYMRLSPEDFHVSGKGGVASDITIICKLAGLSIPDKAAFVEYLTHEKDDQVLYIHWTAHRLAEQPGSRRWVDVVVKGGADGSGPSLDSSIRQLLATAYLRPLRDAEKEMSSGRGSRLSQILSNFPGMKVGSPFDQQALPADLSEAAALSLSGLADYLRHLVNQHEGVATAQNEINTDYLQELSLWGENLRSQISFVESGTEAARLRQILERLELELLHGTTGAARGKYGLGSNNLLFMACELLLLGKEREGLPLLLVEEPEAHLHPQRQLRLMQFLEAAAKKANRRKHAAAGDGAANDTADGTAEATGTDSSRSVQIIVTTHSPNLASKIPLRNLVIIQNQTAFSLAESQTELSTGDYRFLERFLDVTKSNLFFAKGVIVVEGPGEAILLPTIARILGRDLTHHGVSLVNVGGTGLRRYAKIFQRKVPARGTLATPVACIADMDVMPDCASGCQNRCQNSVLCPEFKGAFDGRDLINRLREIFQQGGLKDHRRSISGGSTRRCFRFG
ncbi:MAG: chromosome segregation protein [Akkermansiaceae bacterium]|nr:chromosome segregation protein [Akkermansiaceae bacterium]